MVTVQRTLSILLLSLLQLIVYSYAKEEDLRCGVCRAVVNEVQLTQRSADPKKKVKVGSFRVDSNGNQKTVDIPMSKSESFIYEAFEKLCERMPQWGVLLDQDTKKRAVIRKYNMEGAMVDGLDSKAQSRLTSLCNEFLEDYEEDAVPIFQNDNEKDDEREKALCVELTGVCTEEDLKYHSEAQSKGIRDAIMKQAQAGKDTINVSPGIVKPLDDEENDAADDDADDDDDDNDETKDEL